MNDEKTDGRPAGPTPTGTLATPSPVKVGDELALRTRYGRSYAIHTVSKVTPSGRITLGDGLYVLNPDLSIRGYDSWSPIDRFATRVTDAIRHRARMDTALTAIKRTQWTDLSDEVVLAVYDLVKP